MSSKRATGSTPSLDPECPEVGECPTATVREPAEARARQTDAPRVHITDETGDRTRCGHSCATADPTPMPENVAVADEWVVAHLGRDGDVEVCVACARAYLGTERAAVSWRHRLAAQVVYGRDIGTTADTGASR